MGKIVVMNYDDLVLQVAEELELTAIGGDFMKISLGRASRPWQLRHALVGLATTTSGSYMKPDGKGGYEENWGAEITLTIELAVDRVLAGRQVKAEDVVSLFIPDKNGMRTVTLVHKQVGTCFQLQQRDIADKEFFEDYLELTRQLSKQTTEMVDEVAQIFEKVRALTAEWEKNSRLDRRLTFEITDCLKQLAGKMGMLASAKAIADGANRQQLT